MDDTKKGSDESRTPEVVGPPSPTTPTVPTSPTSPTSDIDPRLLPGAVGGVDEDEQAEKIKNLRNIRARTRMTTLIRPPSGGGDTTTAKPSLWLKARTRINAHAVLTNQMLALRGLVGTATEGAATIEETEEMLRRERILQRGKWYIVMPDSNLKMAWDLAQVVVLLYVAAIVPLRIGFDTSSSPFSTLWWIEVVIDTYFLVDIILNFLTAYTDDTGSKSETKHEVVTDLKAIRNRYLKGFFLIDVLSILPVNYIEQAMSGGDVKKGGNLKTLKILRLIRLTRLLRLARVKMLVKKYTDMLENLAGIFSLLSIIVVAIFLSHFVSCAWYWLGSTDGGWVPMTFDCEECVHAGSSISQRYLATYWWSLTLLLTAEMSNNIQPHSTGEILFVIMLQLMGAIVFGFIIGTVGTILMSWGLLEEKISRKLAELREFMNEKGVPKKTRKKVKKFMEDYYRSKAGYDETEVVYALPPSIALELLDSIYRGALLKVPIFKDLDEDVICRICLLMRPMHVAKGEYVFKEKEVGREMYIIREGRVQIMRFGMTIGVLHKNCFFGEDCMVQVLPGKRNFRQRTAFAIEDCELAFLRSTDADKIALDYPEMLESFKNLASKKACVEHERLNMMINQVADELGVDPDSHLMTDVLTAVSTIASEDEMLSTEVKAARKIANWWRHTKKRREGRVKGKFPPTLEFAVEPEAGEEVVVKTRIRKMIKTSALWKSSVKVAQQEIAVQAEQAAETDEPHADDLKPVPPAEMKPAGQSSRDVVSRGGIAKSSNESGGRVAVHEMDTVAVQLHALQEQVEKIEFGQKKILAHQNESDLHAERLDAKLQSIAAAIEKLDRKLALA